MNRKEAKELSPFIKAFGEWKDIEIRSKNPHAQLNGWAKMDEFIFGNFEYRIKQEPKYRPFANAEECWQEMLNHQPFGWVKTDSGYVTICHVNEGDDFNATFKDITFADGTPFGIKEEE